MGNDMDKIMPGLYVGNYRDSKDAAQLEKYRITHILSIHDTAKRLYPDKHYLCVVASDKPNQNLSQYFALCNDFIHAARSRDGNVLIHCLAGMSRSVTVTVAYIMSVTTLNWKDALKVVRVGRAVANPNSGFQKQLQEFENFKLFEERKRLKERFSSIAFIDLDEFHCQLMLKSYQRLVFAKRLCEGNCSKNEACPTGICNLQNRKTLNRGIAFSKTYSSTEIPSTSIKRTESLRRPSSGPVILKSSSLPPIKISSVQSIPELVHEKPKFASAPCTPQKSLSLKTYCNFAPLVSLNEIVNK